MNNRKRLPLIIIGLLFLWYIFNPFAFISHIFHTSTVRSYPPPHPYSSKHTIETQLKSIYPRIQDANYLKQLGVRNLIASVKTPGYDEPELKSLNILDDEDTSVQKAKEDEQNEKDPLLKAKNYFKNQDKIVYRPKSLDNYPEVVIVTVVDFNKYSEGGLVKIVQNRVDYAHYQKCGLYVRWAQEFIPQLGSLAALEDDQKSKWVRLFCLRAAMFAFPHAQWFWYLDENGLIMDMSRNIQQILLNPEALEKQMLRDQPLIPPDGLIKTYKSTKAKSIKLIAAQLDTMIETGSFFVKNDAFGKALVDIWSDKLYLNYKSFPYETDSALTHILQWHPLVLSKTALVPAKAICAPHSSKDSKNTYQDGDFVASWSSCKTNEECESILNIYQNKLTESKP
ncbi:MNN11 [Candida oxycetoniae]|uniref:MNN11 n=1 Tax=Candida oxycetoniae TaxID=497107 RepID=A0AAI9SY69_9ASCO|nr:MNN11 [Candida oxycetoniae]KAI3404947.2 MNN11 [Candida oxycetoniae]